MMYVGERCSIVTCAAVLRQRRARASPRSRRCRSRRRACRRSRGPSATAAGARCGPRKRSRPAKLGRVALVVVVVAGAHEQEVAGEAHELACARRARPRPSSARRRRPARALHAVAEADLPIDAVLCARSRGCRPGSTAPSAIALRVRPRPERVTRACTCPSPSGCRDSGTRSQVPPSVSRASRIAYACRDSSSAGGRPRRCPRCRRRRSARRRGAPMCREYARTPG